MATTVNTPKRTSRRLLTAAVHRNRLLTMNGLRERLFTLFFRGLVYPQIWEDPVVDLEALQIRENSRIVTIASGGCNVLSYLTANPARITAVDLNAAHVALNRLKLCAVRRITDYETFYRFFGAADCSENIVSYEACLKRHLDPDTLDYWEGRDALGRKRITRFARGFYKYGVLGHFIGSGHLFARMLGANPRAILEARSLEEQREIFDRTLAPLFDNRCVKWVLNRPALLYGLGIPPAQYQALAGSGAPNVALIIKQRLERLACDVALDENYFAWQAFNRSYPPAGAGRLPPYLEERNFKALASRTDRVDIRLVSFTDYLREQPAASHDCYVLLDAQDWMADRDLTTLWAEITRTARPDARVIFRTAAEKDILPGRVDQEILKNWHYEAERSRQLERRDRSAIYGGFHLYKAREFKN